MLKKNFCLLITVMSAFCSFSAIMQFTGYYNGKNLFIENPYIESLKERCITNVYVNSKHLLDHPKESICEVNLSGFKVGDTLTFRVYHKDGYTPILVNKHEIEPNTNHFKFIKMTVTETTISWESKGESVVGKYSVEQHINGQWVTIQNVKAKGTLSVNTYSSPSHTLSGDNKYRIKYKASGGLVVTSDEFFFHSSKTSVVFYPKRVVDFITFESDNHREVEFTVLDNTGHPLIEGKSLLVDCRRLAVGYYIIRYENKEERFYKKDVDEVEPNTNVGGKK
jgi:hypothetical protein